MGGAGYVGSHVAKELIHSGLDCTVADNLSSGHEKAATIAGAKFVRADLHDSAALDKLFAEGRFDAVIHLAASLEVAESAADPLKYYYNNVSGTISLLRAMERADVKRMVFSSTAAVYGSPDYSPIDEIHPTHPINPYGATKAAVEKILADLASAKGFKYIALRYFNAAGAAPDGTLGESRARETHLVPLVLKAVKAGAPVKVFGNDYDTKDGSCIRDYVHVSDLATAHRLALTKLDETQSEAVNLGSGQGSSVFEIISAVENITGAKCCIEVEPRRPGDPPILIASNAKAKKILNWKPEFGLDDIIRTAWNWEKNKKF
jgi:UDP-glucose 4-epimerase